MSADEAMAVAAPIAARFPRATLSAYTAPNDRSMPGLVPGRGIRIDGCSQGEALELGGEIARAIYPGMGPPIQGHGRNPPVPRNVSWFGGYAVVWLPRG
jgi:hypothetical protein